MKDPYLYENSDCLINKANLKDKMKLEEFENRMTKVALVSIFKSEIRINNSQDMFIIHKSYFKIVERFSWLNFKQSVKAVSSSREQNNQVISFCLLTL